MKTNPVLILIFLFLSILSVAQESDTSDYKFFEAKSPIRSKFRFSGGFHAGLGIWNSDIKSTPYTDLPKDGEYILSTTRRYFYTLQSELQFIFRDRFGFELGFDIIGSRVNKDRIEKEFTDYISKKSFVVDKSKIIYQSFNDKIELRVFKFGYSRYIRTKRFVIIPSIDLLTNFGNLAKFFHVGYNNVEPPNYFASYPSFKINYIGTTDPKNSSNVYPDFIREYRFANASTFGGKLGVSYRCYVKNQKRHSKLYLQIKAEFIGLRTLNRFYYVETTNTGQKNYGYPYDLRQEIYAFNLGVTLFGFEFK